MRGRLLRLTTRLRLLVTVVVVCSIITTIKAGILVLLMSRYDLEASIFFLTAGAISSLGKGVRAMAGGH